ncbi:MAG: DUF3299 domain-containing protein [Thiohalocapsa sp.]
MGQIRKTLLPALISLLLGACGEQSSPPATQQNAIPNAADSDAMVTAEHQVPAVRDTTPDGVQTLDWDDLIPADWQAEELTTGYDVGKLTDDDPRARSLLAELRIRLARAPVVAALNGQRVRLLGLVLPLQTDAAGITEFLLVPYFGACIHLPPQPANQTVHVLTGDSRAYRGELFETVWVEGRLRIKDFSDSLGDAGYRIEDAEVSYDDDSR